MYGNSECEYLGNRGRQTVYKEILPRLEIFKIQKAPCETRTEYKSRGYYFDKIIQIVKS